MDNRMEQDDKLSFRSAQEAGSIRQSVHVSSHMLVLKPVYINFSYSVWRVDCRRVHQRGLPIYQ